MSHSNLTGLGKTKLSIDHWTGLLQRALLRCSHEFVIKEMKNWFRVLHATQRQWLVAAVKYMKMFDEYKSSDDKEGDKKNKIQNPVKMVKNILMMQ